MCMGSSDSFLAVGTAGGLKEKAEGRPKRPPFLFFPFFLGKDLFPHSFKLDGEADEKPKPKEGGQSHLLHFVQGPVSLLLRGLIVIAIGGGVGHSSNHSDHFSSPFADYTVCRLLDL